MKHEMPTFDDHADDASLYCSVRRVRRGFVCTVAASVLDSWVPCFSDTERVRSDYEE